MERKFFFLFHGLSNPSLARNKLLWCFFKKKFLNFFGNCLVRVGNERNSKWNFFFLFLSLAQPDLARNNARMMFFNFLNLFAIFWEFFSQGRIGTEFETTIFFFLFLGLSNPGLARNKLKWCLFNFCYFFGNPLAKVG